MSRAASRAHDGQPRVLRICSVFEPPDAALTGRGAAFDPMGGMQNHTGELTRLLAQRGVAQVVLTTRPPGAPRRQLKGRVAVHRHGVPVPWARQLWAITAVLAAPRLARSADLVHAHLGEDVAVLPIALLAARRAGIPLVVTVHCSVRHTFVPAGLRGHVLKRLGGRLEASIVPRADRVIAITPRLAERLRASGVAPDRIDLIPPGVVPDAFAGEPADPFPDVPRPRVAFVGRLHRSKGVGRLLEAAARLRTPGVQLVLVGGGPDRARLEATARRLGLAGRVHFAGFLAHREIPAVLRHADVLALPSVYEELGSVLLEAMQAGLPIVASRTGGVPDAVGPAGELVPPGDVPALAAALDRLLGDPVARDRLVRLGRERARRHAWPVLAAQVAEVYRVALGAAPARRARAAQPGESPPT